MPNTTSHALGTFAVLSIILLGLLGCQEEHRIGDFESIYVIDGDTFRYTQNGETFTVRVMGVDTPEMKGQCAKEIKQAKQAKAFVKKLLRNASSLTFTQLDRDTDKYGRLLRRVSIDGQRLDTALIKAKLGRVYHGGKRKGWCGA